MNKYFITLVSSIMIWLVYFLVSIVNQSVIFDSQMFIFIAISSSLLIANAGKKSQSDAMKTLFILLAFINVISVAYVNFGNRNHSIDIAFGIVCITIALFSIYFKMKLNAANSLGQV